MEEILVPAGVSCGGTCTSKKKALEHIANVLATGAYQPDADAIFKGLVTRERFGSTGFGQGFALPHCRLDSCLRPFYALIRLDKPVDFEAKDLAPVDLFFALIVPTQAVDEQLKYLQLIARQLAKADYLHRLRSAKDSAELYLAALTCAS